MKKNDGFTMIELIIVFALISILTAIAIPGYRLWRPEFQLKSAAQDVYSNLQRARLAAIKENRNCVMLFENDGYVVFVDDDENFAHGAGEVRLGYVRWKNYDGFVLPDAGSAGNGNGSSVKALAFRPNGMPRNQTHGGAGGIGGGTVYLTNTKGTKKEIRVSTAGNIRIIRN